VVLVDTSVWIRALAGAAPFRSKLDRLIDREEILAHELIYGELLIGDAGGRKALLESYSHVPYAPVIPHAEVAQLVRSRKLYGRGIGWSDAHLLASALVAGAQLWTADSPLAAIARELRIEGP
jgi:predicted nucleic acid-binding protein